ncbi:MAG TPA: hypothetical protein VF857_05530 [Spirochaetota bacterium]
MTKNRQGADSTGIDMSMKKTIAIVIFSFCLALTFMHGRAEARESDPFKLPQVGVWFGPITPVYETRKEVDTALGGGAFVRVNLGQSPFKLGMDGSYQKYKSKSLNEVKLVPLYGSILYRLPFSSLLVFQLKLGAGGSYIKAFPINKSQWDPLFVGGGEMSFPLGATAAIGLRVEYLMLYEKHISGAKKNGNFVNTGLSINFNLDMFD